jgi:hypothetical protein
MKEATTGKQNSRHAHYEDYAEEDHKLGGYFVGPMLTLAQTNQQTPQPSRQHHYRRQHHQKVDHH